MPQVMLTLAAESGSFQANMKKAADSVKGIQDMIGTIQASAIVYLGQAAMAAGERILDFTRSISETGKEIARMSEISGLSTTKWQEWSGAAYLANVNQDSFARGIKFLSRSMSDSTKEGTKAGEAFAAMGLSVKDTSGNTKSLDMMMGQIADKFASWEDGPNKIAIALALFGRSGQEMIPILDKGSKGIQEMQGELTKLGAILGADTVKHLAEAEEEFKKLDLVWKATKTQTLAPLVEMVTNLLTGIQEIKRTLETTGWAGLWAKMRGKMAVSPKGSPYSTEAVEKYETELYKYAQYEAPPAAKKEGPALVNPDNPFGIPGFSLRKVTEELNKLKAQAASTAPSAIGWGAEETTGVKAGEMAIEGMIITIKDYEQSLKDLDSAYMKTIDMEEIRGPAQAEANSITGRSIALENERKQSVLDLTKQYAELTDNLQLVISVDKAQEDEYIRVNNLTDQQIALIRLLGNERRTQLANREIVDEVTDVARSMSSTWSSNLMDMFKGTQSFADGMKKIFTDMGDIIIKKLLEITANYLLMGNITGSKITGGLFGGVGNLLSGLFGGGGVPATGYGGAGIGGTVGFGSAMQTGGIVTSPKYRLTGEVPEAIIPLKGGKVPVEGGGGGDTYNTFIQATDLGSFARLYGPTIESIYFKGKRFNRVSMRNQ